MKIQTITIANKEGKQIELTLEEARDLHKELDSIFHTPVITTPIILREVYRPYYWPVTWTGDNICIGKTDSDLTISYNCGE